MRKMVLGLFMFTLTVSQLAAQEGYCSKYKGPTEGKRLDITDFRSDTFDILHTTVTLDFTQMGSQFISGFAELDFKVLQAGVSELVLDFEGLDVDSVVGSSVQSFDHQDSMLVVVFSSPLTQNQQLSIRIHYNGSPMKDASGWGGFYFNGPYAWNLGVGFADDPHSYGRIWFPCFDNFIERSTFEYFITPPIGRRASCNGVLSEILQNANGTQTFHWELDQSIPSYLACVAVSNYTTVDWQHAGVQENFPVQLHAVSGDTNGLKTSFTHLDDALDAFENAYGKYRFDKVGYTLVPFNSGAMEHATNITYPRYAANGNLANESLMSHELAHMWWGDNITCQTDGDMWINEGWASFSEYLFDEHVYGREEYEDHMLSDLRYMLQYGHHYEEGYRAVSGQPHEYVYGDHVYKKGALVAHNLRGYLGDEVFFDACAAFMETYEMSPVSSDSLERFFTTHTGVDLSYFFRDWVFNGGYNVVVLDSFKALNQGGNYSVSLYLQQKLKGTSVFHDQVPVHYTVYNDEWESESGIAVISGKYATQSISTTLNPAVIFINSGNELAQARTADLEIVRNTGNLNLDNMFWDVSVESIEDSALVNFEHVWSYPDPMKEWDVKAYTMSNYHYWKVSGVDLDKVELSGTFFYDGRYGGASGFMDMDLVTVTEDSLVLLYRSTSSADWVEYPHYQKNVLGLSDNAFGLIELDQILGGEYVLANQDHGALGVSQEESAFLNVFPNPSSGMVDFELKSLENAQLVIFDSAGAMVYSGALKSNQNRVDLSAQANGTYVYTVRTSTEVLKGKIVLEKN